MFVALITLSMIAGQILGQPILLGFVETGSMEPTLNSGDGFVAVPAAFSGEIQQGDVIIYRAEKLHGGGLTTHRVVGSTKQGYLTKGDANPFTDQAGGEPPVRRPQVVAEALRIGGKVVRIPHLGTSVMAIHEGISRMQEWVATTFNARFVLGTKGIAYFIFSLSAIAYFVDYIIEGKSRKVLQRTRTRKTGLSTHLILVGLALMLIISATGSMILPAGTHQIEVVSAGFDSENPTVIPQGESRSFQYHITNSGYVPVHIFLDSESEEVSFDSNYVHISGQTRRSVKLTLHAPKDTGYYHRYFTEHRYLAILPLPVTRDLYQIHHWLPVILIDTILGIGVYMFGILLIGNKRVRIRNQEKHQKGSIINRLL